MEEKEINESVIEKDYKDLYVRLYAEFDNYKKRTIKEKEDIRRLTKTESLASILELDNDLHIAIKSIKDKKSIKSIQILTDKFASFLKKQGIEDVQTDVYDVDIHEVISVLGDGKNIVDVVSKGYKLNGVVVKHPKVILGK